MFICGMMVGRTPEYLGRKVETREMKLALLALLVHPLFILGGTALFAATPWGAATVHNPGAHGFSEILYEFSSAAANNGSEFSGLGGNTVPWNVATGIVMLFARFIPILLPLAIAGSLAAKKPTPETVGTLRTDTPLFGWVILGSVILIGALLFLPVAVLGPISGAFGSAPVRAGKVDDAAAHGDVRPPRPNTRWRASGPHAPPRHLPMVWKRAKEGFSDEQ